MHMSAHDRLMLTRGIKPLPVQYSSPIRSDPMMVILMKHSKLKCVIAPCHGLK